MDQTVDFAKDLVKCLHRLCPTEFDISYDDMTDKAKKEMCELSSMLLEKGWSKNVQSNGSQA